MLRLAPHWSRPAARLAAADGVGLFGRAAVAPSVPDRRLPPLVGGVLQPAPELRPLRGGLTRLRGDLGRVLPRPPPTLADGRQSQPREICCTTRVSARFVSLRAGPAPSCLAL